MTPIPLLLQPCEAAGCNQKARPSEPTCHIHQFSHDMRAVLIERTLLETMVDQLDGRMEWGDQDEYGFHNPTVYSQHGKGMNGGPR